MNEADKIIARRLWAAAKCLWWQQTEAEAAAYHAIMQQLYALPGSDDMSQWND
jgi:hypothetical protein